MFLPINFFFLFVGTVAAGNVQEFLRTCDERTHLWVSYHNAMVYLRAGVTNLAPEELLSFRLLLLSPNQRLDSDCQYKFLI